jgi:hypothetical protein
MTQPIPQNPERDPAKADARDIREEADREIEAYEDLSELVLLMPEDRWDEFLRLTGATLKGDDAEYRGVTFRKAAVTAVIAQEGF